MNTQPNVNAGECSPASPCSASHPLFKHMSDNYQLTLLESEIHDIEAEVVRGIISRDMHPLFWHICDHLAQESITEGQQVELAEKCLKLWLETRGVNYSPNAESSHGGEAR